MATPDEARRALILVTGRAVRSATSLIYATDTIDDLLEGVPAVIDLYSVGSAALAADHYEDMREVANASRSFTAEPIVLDRSEKVRRGILWATESLRLTEPDYVTTEARMAEVVQFETAKPFRSTILANSQRDAASVGWRRNSGDGCKFCRMLAGNGAVYKESTARFASHPHCDCTAVPVFDGQPGEEASALQYVASQRRKTQAQRQALNRYLAALPD